MEWKRTAKAELSFEIHRSPKKKSWKNQCSFCHQSSSVSQKAWMLSWVLHAGFDRIRSENLRLRSTLKSIRSEFWMKGTLVTVEICVPCGWRFSNQFDVVSKTPYSCDTVGFCELWWAILCALLCPETDWNIHVGKQGYVSSYVCFVYWVCFLATKQDQFFLFGLFSLDCRLRPLEYLSWVIF